MPKNSLMTRFVNQWVEQIVPKSSAVKLTDESLIKTLRRWILTLFYWMGKPSYSAAPLAGVLEVLRLWQRTAGWKGVVLRLKISSIVIRKFISGEKLQSTTELGLRLRLTNGLPAWLPLTARNAIRARQAFWIRFWIMFCDLYRSLSFPWKSPDLSTITACPLDTATIIFGQWRYFTIQFWTEFAPDHLRTASRSRDGDHLSGWFTFDRGFALHSSSPLGRSSNSRHMDVLATIWEVASPCGINLPLRILEWLSPPAADFMKMFIVADGALSLDWGWDFRKVNPVMSRLHFIGESAGKVRIIAIMDYWTQFVMKPIHDFLFDLLKRHSICDATFDQLGVLEGFVDRCKGSPFYCYDLKSATDLIPLSLSLELLRPIFGETMCDALHMLLVDRDFQVGNTPGHTVRYSRGQPMGALGSWAIMSLTHHALVRFSAFRAGKSDFVSYLVLGDDLVIADTAVADAYRDVCAQFGIPIGLPKSYVSVNGFLEFARRTYLGTQDLSPVSFRDYLDNSVSSLCTRAVKLFRGGFQPTTNPLVRLCRFALTRFESRALHDNLVVRGGVSTVLINRLCLLLVPNSSGRWLATSLGLVPKRHLAAWVDLLGGQLSILQGLCHNRVPRSVPLREQLGYVVYSLDGVLAHLRSRNIPKFALDPLVDVLSPRLESWPNRWSICASGFQTAAAAASRSTITQSLALQAEWTVEFKQWQRMRSRSYSWDDHFFKIVDLFIELTKLYSFSHWQTQLDLFNLAKREQKARRLGAADFGISRFISLLRLFYKLYSRRSYTGALSRTVLDQHIDLLRAGAVSVPDTDTTLRGSPVPGPYVPPVKVVKAPRPGLYRSGPSGKRSASARFTRLPK